jgi:hypothetical protein
MLSKEIVGNKEYPHGPELDEATRRRIAQLQASASQPGYTGGAPQSSNICKKSFANPEINKAAMNQWIHEQLGQLIVRKQLGSHKDPVRDLAEKGILHFDPNTVPIIGGHETAHEHAESRREMLNGQKMAKGPLAQAWGGCC